MCALGPPLRLGVLGHHGTRTSPHGCLSRTAFHSDMFCLMSPHRTQRATQELCSQNLRDCRKWLKGTPEFSLTVSNADFCFKCWLMNIPPPYTGALSTPASNAASSGEACLSSAFPNWTEARAPPGPATLRPQAPRGRGSPSHRLSSPSQDCSQNRSGIQRPASVGGQEGEGQDTVTCPSFPVEEPGSRFSQHARRGNGGFGLKRSTAA